MFGAKVAQSQHELLGFSEFGVIGATKATQAPPGWPVIVVVINWLFVSGKIRSLKHSVYLKLPIVQERRGFAELKGGCIVYW
jgi:hypothetical protein